MKLEAKSWEDVLKWRIARHHLGDDKGRNVVEVARRVGGLHAQVASSAQAAADLRLKKSPDLDKALYQDRTLVRTWAARGTLHLLPAADLPLWVAAMSTRTREKTASWLRYQHITAEQMQALIDAVPDVLGAEPMTRAELADALVEATGHDLREQLNHGFAMILKPLAFRGLLCSGPPQGRSVTFVAPQAWFGEFTPPPAEEGIDTLALGWLGTYGPAYPEEFARWFDLTPSLAKKSFARLAPKLTEVPDWGFVPDGIEPETSETVLLLPAFDPYVVGSTRQLDKVSTGPKAKVSRPQGWISPTLVVDGRIEGVWEPSKEGPRVTPFGKLTAKVARALPADATIV